MLPLSRRKGNSAVGLATYVRDHNSSFPLVLLFKSRGTLCTPLTLGREVVNHFRLDLCAEECESSEEQKNAC